MKGAIILHDTLSQYVMVVWTGVVPLTLGLSQATIIVFYLVLNLASPHSIDSSYTLRTCLTTLYAPVGDGDGVTLQLWQTIDLAAAVCPPSRPSVPAMASLSRPL
jgi:hypothetical protein